MEKISAGFIGAGGIARSHAFALDSLRYYYKELPRVELTAVSSATAKSRDSFAAEYRFMKPLAVEEFFSDDSIDTVFILGPNKVHCDHLEKCLGMNGVKRIYIEKPLCSSRDEELRIAEAVVKHPGIKIQVGFQFLFMTAVREMLRLWMSGSLGKPVHFEAKYYHGDYLEKSYREKRANRLTPSPDGGAMADLGSHSVSMLAAFLGDGLEVTAAQKAGGFPDVDPRSDLFSTALLKEPRTGAAGTLSASRISAGTGDMLSLELYAEKGAMRFTSYSPDQFEYFTEESGQWHRVVTGSRYDTTSFPSAHVPPGWLRPLIHAHYAFLTGMGNDPLIPGIQHALEVQRIIREVAEALNA